MQRFYTVFLLVWLVLTATAQLDDYKNRAAEMNRRADISRKKVYDRSVTDSSEIYRAVIDAVNYSLKCDEYERMQSQTGGKSKYASANEKRLVTFHGRLLDAADYYYRNGNVEEGNRTMILYINATEHPFLKGQPDMSGLAAWRLAQEALKVRNYKAADRFANISLAYDNAAQLGAEIKAQCMRAQMVTPQDSAKYLAVVNKLYETDPNNEKYFAWIMQFFDRPQQRHKLEYFVDKELENNPNTIVPWILKGEIAMKAKRWMEAADAYKHADEIDPSNVPVVYNIGICLNHIALDKLETARKEGKPLTAGEEHQMKQMLAESRTYLERVRGRDPRRKRVDWVKPLYMVYTVLGDQVKAEELKPLATGFKNEY